MAFTREESGLTLDLEITYPARDISSPITNFFFERIMFNLSQQEVISLIRMDNSLMFNAQIMMSSQVFLPKVALLQLYQTSGITRPKKHSIPGEFADSGSVQIEG